MITVVLLFVALAGILAALVGTVRLDGYGHRPPPRSHPHELENDAWSAGR